MDPCEMIELIATPTRPSCSSAKTVFAGGWDFTYVRIGHSRSYKLNCGSTAIRSMLASKYAEMARRVSRKFDRRYRDIGAGGDVKLEEFAVVHLVDVIAAQDQDVLRVFSFDRVNVLVDRIGSSLVPLFGRPKLRRDRVNE